jgi:hypothetical protein
MKKRTKAESIFLFLATLLIASGCYKNKVEPSMDGTWVEIDNIDSMNPTGCELVIDKDKGNVSMCGFDFIHPKNVMAIFVRADAQLFIEEGQFYYRQKKADILWVAPIAHEDLYFLDYEFEGNFLWVKGENTSAKTGAKNGGRVFMKN